MVDTIKLRKVFSRAARDYEAHAFIQKRIGEELLSRVAFAMRQPESILDIGMGTGWLTQRLALRYPASKIAGMDLAEGMLAFAASQKQGYSLILSDAQELPFKENSWQLVVSNAAYQWVRDLPAAFGEVMRVLKKGGLFIFNCFGQDTLKELRQSFKQALSPQVYARAFSNGSLPAENLIHSALAKAGFKDIILTTEAHEEYYADIFALIEWLKIIGVNQVNKPLILGPRAWEKAGDFYRLNFSQDSRVFATFEIIWASAKKE